MRKLGTTAGAIAALSGCGVPSNPENGPVVLLCEGSRYLRAGNGEVEREKLTRFYKVDGITRSLDTWDADNQTWMGSPSRITITPNQIKREDAPFELAGITSLKTITIDRVAGRVHDENTTSGGGVITFDGDCKPVKSPTDGRKF